MCHHDSRCTCWTGPCAECGPTHPVPAVRDGLCQTHLAIRELLTGKR